MNAFRYLAVSNVGVYVHASDNLESLLATLGEIADPASGQDIVVWRDGKTVAAMFWGDGSFIICESVEEGRP
jgi:hypothetical protein